MNDNMNSTLTDVIQHLTRYLGVDGEIIIEESTPKSVHVIVRSNEAGRLIGRKGRTLQAIRHLVYSIMKREDMVDLNIILDVDGYNDAARPEHNRNRSGSSRDRQRRRERPSRRRHPSPNRSRTQDDTRTPALIATEEQEDAMAETITATAQPSSVDNAPSTFPETDASHFSDEQPSVSPAEDIQSEGRQTKPEPASQPEEKPQNFRCQQALEAIKEVRRWGEPVSLPPMNEEDRKVVREALVNFPDVEIIEGEVTGPHMRRITIRLKD